MTKPTLLVAAAPLLLVAACNPAAENDATTGVDSPAMQTGAMIDAAAMSPDGPVTAATDYAREAALGDMYEIESSRMALENAQSAEVKQFAQKMIDEHQATTASLKDGISQAGLAITPPPALDPRRRGLIDQLAAMSGTEFDTAYLDQQTQAHEEALNLHQGYAEAGDNPALKQVAAEIAPKVRMHYQMVQQLDEGGADDRTATAG